MAEAVQSKPEPTLTGWLTRDALITLGVGITLWGLHGWHIGAGSAASTIIGPSLAFIASYSMCYLYHEWGHWLGARWSGGRMPLAPYAGVVIGSFAIEDHTRRQFLWLSWGGVIAYVSTMAIAVSIHFSGVLGLVGAGLAVGGLAFVAQSLSVDLPQIWRITKGADIAATSAAGANARVILRRTWQSWIPLAAALAAWNVLQ